MPLSAFMQAKHLLSGCEREVSSNGTVTWSEGHRVVASSKRRNQVVILDRKPPTTYTGDAGRALWPLGVEVLKTPRSR
jgi:hypothetical protein